MKRGSSPALCASEAVGTSVSRLEFVTEPIRGPGSAGEYAKESLGNAEPPTGEVVMAINERLQRRLDQTRSSHAVLPHDEAYTAQEVAQSVRVKGGQLAKVVVLRDAAGKDIMVVLPATRAFDPHAVHRVTGRAGIQLEDERELERLFPDCEVGAMPPFGSLYDMPMYVDPCLLQAENIVFQAGNHHEVVLMRSQEYEQIARPFHAGSCLHRESERDEGPGVCPPALAKRVKSGLRRVP
jgi:Ala-tRNA(Pro) deacylase